MTIHNVTRRSVIATHAVLADTFLSRFIGLMGRDHLPDDEALLITQCQSIHMMFMKIPLDIIFLDKNKRVVGLQPNIQPWQFSRMYWKAYYALEASPGRISASHTECGDQLDWTSEERR